MSDQEKKSSGVAATGSIVMVEQTGASRHKQPYRPTELHDGATSDLHHRHSRVPPASSLAEELKVFTIHQDIEEQKECDRATSSEKHKQSETKIISGNTKRRESSPETIALAALEVETKKGPLPFSSQPIPAQAETVISATSNLVLEKIQETSLEKKADDDSITEEVAELRTSDAAENRSVWSDDEEAGGLPRSESRASRVSRAMRQMFCCGVRYHAPSEENVSSAQENATGI